MIGVECYFAHFRIGNNGPAKKSIANTVQTFASDSTSRSATHMLNDLYSLATERSNYGDAAVVRYFTTSFFMLSRFCYQYHLALIYDLQSKA